MRIALHYEIRIQNNKQRSHISNVTLINFFLILAVKLRAIRPQGPYTQVDRILTIRQTTYTKLIT